MNNNIYHDAIVAGGIDLQIRICMEKCKHPNEIIIKENHAEIILIDRKCEEIGRTLIDLEDVEKIKQYRWCLNRNYVVNRSKVGKLHRFLLNLTNPKILVDHKNHNTLDNRKENLRKCSPAENQHNQKINKRSASKYKGVNLDKNSGKWAARIRKSPNLYRLGKFTNEEEAALAYNEKAKELFGEFACLNDVKPKLKLRKKSIYAEAVIVGGVDLQLRMVIEECLELSLEVVRFFRGRSSVEKIAEEVADVEIMCSQLRQMIGDRIVDDQKALKLKRLRKRIEENNMENDENLTKGEEQ